MIHRWRSIVLLAALCFGGAQLIACDQMPPIDENYDSSLGADFRAPDTATDAGSPDAGVP